MLHYNNKHIEHTRDINDDNNNHDIHHTHTSHTTNNTHIMTIVDTDNLARRILPTDMRSRPPRKLI